MDLELEKRLNDLLSQALAVAPSERRPFLEQACGEDRVLLREALELLACDDEGSGFLETPAGLAVTRAEPGATPRGSSDRGPTAVGDFFADFTQTVDQPDLIGRKVRQFRIVELLGRGGMGNLYIGFDEVLRRQVAIKAIRDAQLKTRTRALFLREARILSQLEHPNICRIYEYLEEDSGDFLVLELIRGKTLRGALAEELSATLKLRIAKQIAGGLAAAHAKGIVHCDLKPANVMLTDGNEAKILDFGIASVRQAQGIAAETSGATWRPRQGVIVGTPGYMSPEQAGGNPVDAATDVYALGLLLQELFTGQPAYYRGSPDNLFVRMICGGTVPIRGLAPELTALIGATLALEPEERPSASEVAERMDWMTITGSGFHHPEAVVHRDGPEDPTHPPARDSETARPETEAQTVHRRLFGLGGAAIGGAVIGVLVLLAAAAGWRFASRSEPAPAMSVSAVAETAAPETAAPELVAKRVMVIPFDNRTGDRELDSFGVIAADWLTQGLSRAGTLDVVPLDLAVRSARFVAGQAEDEKDQLDHLAVARETGSGIVISGAYYRRRQELILRGQITDVAGRKTLSATESLRTPISDPIGVLEDLEEAVRTRVATHLDRQLAPFGDLVARPPSYQAYEAYVSGMELYWQLDFNGAIESLRLAAEIAPEFPTPQLMSASALMNLGRYAEVQTIVTRLAAEREKLAPLDRFYLDWLEAQCRGDRSRAVQVARQASDVSPHSQWTHVLGVYALGANLPAQAASALAPLNPERGYLRGWTAHFYYLTGAWHLLGDHTRELDDARRGRRLYPGSLNVVLAEARALAVLGEEDELFDLLRQIESLSREFVQTAGSAMTFAAMELEAHGRPKAGIRAAEMAVDWYRRRPPEEASEPLFREGLARALFVAEQLDEAEEVFRELARERPETVDYLGYLGVLATIRGDRSALPIFEQLRALDRPYLFGKHYRWQAAILAWRGEKEQATEQLRLAVSAGHSFGWPELHPHVDPIWRPLRDDPTFLEIIEPRG